jgi:hypothetical protein
VNPFVPSLKVWGIYSILDRVTMWSSIRQASDIARRVTAIAPSHRGGGVVVAMSDAADHSGRPQGLAMGCAKHRTRWSSESVERSTRARSTQLELVPPSIGGRAKRGLLLR